MAGEHIAPDCTPPRHDAAALSPLRLAANTLKIAQYVKNCNVLARRKTGWEKVMHQLHQSALPTERLH